MNLPQHMDHDLRIIEYFRSLPKGRQTAIRLRWGDRILDWFYSSEMVVPDPGTLRESGADDAHIDLCETVRNILKEKECPDCGARLKDTNPGEILDSNPPQKRVGCSVCAYQGLRDV